MTTVDVALPPFGGVTDGEEACAAAHASVAAASAAGAELICLPQWSFAPYVAATRDRAGLELAQRAPAPAWRDALAAAGPAWLSASAYESEGEGVFYLTARLGRDGGEEVAYRQRRLAAAHGRYEQLFCSPGHGDLAVADAPWGPTGLLVGLDAADPQAWAALARRGARLVVAGVAEDEEGWDRLRALARGMAAAHGVAVALANRAGEEHGIAFAGGACAVAAGGEELAVGADGRVAIPVPAVARAAPAAAAPSEDERHEEQQA
ncbi:nitrilase-related carbon-nitrogen hydrolase [Conexibacter arvalis]|nr:nitrilase-related carbon-nitrogen hydrolase [Conexibacter arvalis]